MNYEYKVLLENEELVINAVHTVERTADEFTFIDENNGIVAMFNRNLVQGLVRIEPKIPPAPKEIKVIQPEQPSAKQEDGKSLKTPVNQDVPIETGTQSQDDLKRTYKLKQNSETKGYEVHTEQQVQYHEAHTAIQEVAGSVEPIATPENHIQGEELVEMVYKDITASGIYNPDTKILTVEKGTLIAKNESKSLRNAKNLDGTKAKRRMIMRKHVRHYNQAYNMLTDDIEFTSLNQACCAIAGTVLSPRHYWKVIG